MAVWVCAQGLRLSNRDVSLENILLVNADTPDACVIIDMGMCLRVPAPPPDSPNTRMILRTQVGPIDTYRERDTGRGNEEKRKEVLAPTGKTRSWAVAPIGIAC